AAAIAAELGIERLLCPRASGVLSALGLLASERRRDDARTVMLRGDQLNGERLASEVAALREPLAAGLAEARTEVIWELRYRGQAFELPVEAGADASPDELAELFAAEHERRYGYRDREAPIELVTIHVAVTEPGPEVRPRAGGDELQRGRRRMLFAGEWVEAEVLRGEPATGTRADGPCVFELPEATLVLPPGWSAEADEAGTIRVRAGERADG
ncbi:MAG: hydantoinase/oxoprolinase family protein, partial [Solirubrobacterales bacterium]